MNSHIYVSASSGKDRVDPEDSRTKSVKTTTGSTTSSQSFKKVLDKDKNEEHEDKKVGDSEEEGTAIDEAGEENAADQVFSLFARPKIKPQTGVRMKIALREESEGEEGFTKEISEKPGVVSDDIPKPKKVAYQSGYTSEYFDEKKELPKESPATLFSKINKDSGAHKMDVNLAVDGSHKEVSVKTKDEANPFPAEQLDIARVGVGPIPTVSNDAVVTVAPDRPAPVTIPKDMQQLIDQIAKELSVITTGTKTETIIILRHPPIFDGAKLIVTGFETAKGELNITLGNLTQNAQQVVQQQQHNLLAALEAKGYNVHIFNATTADTQTNVVAQGQVSKDRQQREGDGQGQQRSNEDEA